jgi:hypothetical protein
MRHHLEAALISMTAIIAVVALAIGQSSDIEAAAVAVLATIISKA